MKINGEVFHQSTYRSLTEKELNDEEYLQREFDKHIEEKLGPNATVKYVYDMNMEETATFEMSDDNDGVEGTPGEPPEYLEPTPDLLTDVYIDVQSRISIADFPGDGIKCIENLLSHCANMNFSDKIGYDRIFQQVKQKGGQSTLNDIKRFQNAQVLSVSVGNS